MNLKYYKNSFSKYELRNFRRIEPDLLKIEKTIKIKQLKEKFNEKIIKSAEDLALNTKNEFVVFEYSEENPMLMSNVGMVSLVQSFYRKISENDQNSSSEIILERNSPSPFLWEIKPGDKMEALTNNLFKAPFYEHKNDDYILSISNGEGFIQKIEKINLIPQVFPNIEIFSPHSRRYGVFSKNRLKVALFSVAKINKLINTINIGKKFDSRRLRENLTSIVILESHNN